MNAIDICGKMFAWVKCARFILVIKIWFLIIDHIIFAHWSLCFISSLFYTFFFFFLHWHLLLFCWYIPLFFHISNFQVLKWFFFQYILVLTSAVSISFKSCIYCYVSSQVEEIKDICASFFFPKKLHLLKDIKIILILLLKNVNESRFCASQ